MFDVLRRLAGLAMTAVGATTIALTIAPARAESVLRIVMGSDAKVIDPVWTPSYPTRNHGYMIYDSLFAMNDKFEIKPQMVERYEISSDQLTYDFTLRDVSCSMTARPSPATMSSLRSSDGEAVMCWAADCWRRRTRW